MENIKQHKWWNSHILHAIGISVVFLLCDRSLQIYFFREISWLKEAYSFASCSISLCVFLVFLFSVQKLPKQPYIFFLSIYTCLFLSTLINDGNIHKLVSNAYPIVALCAFVVLQCSSLQRAKRFLAVSSGLFWWLTAINLLLILISPNLFAKTANNGDVFFIGIENHLMYSLTIGLLLNLLNSHFNANVARLQSYVALYFLTALINFSVGSLIGVFIIALYFLVPPVKRLLEEKSFSFFLVIFFVVFITLVFFAEPILTLPPIRFFIENVLGKDVTLTHRTQLWELALQEIAQKPIFGYGVGDSDNLFTLYVWDEFHTWSAHNQYLQTWYTGGSVALCMLVVFLLRSSSLLQRSPDKKMTGYVKVVSIALMVMLLSEAPSFNTLFFTLTLGTTLIYAIQNVPSFQVSSTADSVSDELISVVVPVYNVEVFLPECLDSLLHQTYANLEILLVDDGSTDGSGTICQTYADRDPRFRVIRQENGGLSAARNTGIQQARGKYITFIDSDDYIDTDMIRYLYNLLVNQRADMSVCQKQLITEEGDPISDGNFYRDTTLTNNDDCMSALFLNQGLDTCAWGKLYRLDMFSDIQYPVGKYHEDVFTTYRLIALCDRIAVGSMAAYFYRQRRGSIMQSSFSPKHLHAVEANVQRAEFVAEHYPKLASIARASIVYATNTCAVRLLKSNITEPTVTQYLQAQYRRYEWDFLRGNSRVTSKVFSLLAFISLKTLLKFSRLLHGAKG